MQPRIITAERQQFGMTPLFDDPPILQHQDAIRALDGRKPMRDDQRGAPRHQRLERGLDMTLSLGVERRGRLIQNQNRRVLEHGARNGQTLTLTTREQYAMVADQSIEALGQRLDEFERMGTGRDPLQRIASR
jgi:hypothetical protein